MLTHISSPALVVKLRLSFLSLYQKHFDTDEQFFYLGRRGNLVMHLSCTILIEGLREDTKRGTLYLTAEHKLSWFRLLIGEGTFQCLNPIQSFLREVDSCT